MTELLITEEQKELFTGSISNWKSIKPIEIANPPNMYVLPVSILLDTDITDNFPGLNDLPTIESNENTWIKYNDEGIRIN